MRYLIGYDITDSKRLQRIYRRMIKFATPLQYSVFLFNGTKEQLDKYMQTVLRLYNKKEDDLRIYPLPVQAKYWQIGKNPMPEGIVLSTFVF
ncbi:CRISPR-associated endonuclease Cas2 [[Mannheimia] succiniciproducens]|uniref:CRISPR-associated endoribonuclease Cas2 n=1 Tax=Mannheimia succiniciproducens (strain KCTC 0769BP / MBEL55E) TaxID=221988 RepID=Q65S19_MANSM|nr:CRISPR-associated endonuclease Cas2 [[Mannheimia] succiniciproducens]AAU38241.1 unknown [[Mannheimia] succiniciproducens MBEL55E]